MPLSLDGNISRSAQITSDIYSFKPSGSGGVQIANTAFDAPSFNFRVLAADRGNLIESVRVLYTLFTETQRFIHAKRKKLARAEKPCGKDLYKHSLMESTNKLSWNSDPATREGQKGGTSSKLRR